jgi:predicted amidohydrolase YtcJ
VKKKGTDYFNADIVMQNGKIWINKTSDDKSAVAIKDNFIIYVGDDKGVERFIAPHTKVIDLQEKRVVPGFNDSHAHLLALPARLLGNLREYNPKVKDSAGKIGSILYRIGIFIYGQYFHRFCNFFNTTPMDIRGIGLPVPLLPKFLIKKSWRRMMDEIIKMGITSITEAGLRTWKEFDILQEMYRHGELRIRVNILLAARLLDDAIKRGYRNGYGDEWIRITGVKLYSDGWLSPRTSALLKPYEDVPGDGILFLDYNEAVTLVHKAYENNLRVATHAIGDRAVKTMLKAYKKVLDINRKNNEKQEHRFTIEHATLVPEDKSNGNDLRTQMKDLGVTASIQLNFAASDCSSTLNAIGLERSKNWNVFKSLMDKGILCAGGSDYPITDVSPLWGIQRVITRADVDGDPVGCNPEQNLDVEDALELITCNAAFNSFEEDIKGSIDVGKLADMVVLSEDIIEMGNSERCVDCIHNVDVEMTIIDGKIEYLNPESSLYPFKKGSIST